MGCGASTTSPYGRDTVSSVPPLPHEEVRYHREIESLEYISDAETVDEPSNFSKTVRIKAKCIVARVAHGITDDTSQFDEDIRETEPIFAEEEFDFIRHWLDENTVSLAGAAPALIIEWDPVQAKQAAKSKIKHAPDSSRTVATRVTPLANSNNGIGQPGRSPGIHSQHSVQPQQQQYQHHPHSLSDFISPHDPTLTSPETQSSSALGTTGDNFVLDSTSSNAHPTPMPTPTSAGGQQQHHEVSPASAKYQVKTAAPLPPVMHHSQPAHLDRHKTKSALVRTPDTSEQSRPLPGQMIEAQ